LDPRRIDVMRSMGTRRVALFAGAATVAAVALAGCSAGQVAETALKKPSTYGVNVDNSDGSVAVRGLAVTYVSPKGFPSGANAPLEVSLFNQTTAPVTVQIGSTPLAGADASQGVVAARSVGISGGTPSADPSAATTALPEPTGSRSVAEPKPTATDAGIAPTATASVEPSVTPSAPAFKPAQITIPPLGSVVFRPGGQQTLQLVGLTGPLVPGNSVNIVFAFSNGADPLVLQAPVSIPMSPAPRGSAHHEGVGEGEEGH
jgi:hypothetical protein